MTINSYDLGTQVQVTALFTNLAGDATDPDTVIMNYRIGETGTIVTGTTVSNAIVGTYTALIEADTVGVYLYRFVATGTGKGAGWKAFRVRPDYFD